MAFLVMLWQSDTLNKVLLALFPFTWMKVFFPRYAFQSRGFDSLEEFVKGARFKAAHFLKHPLCAAQPHAGPGHCFRPAGKQYPGVLHLFHGNAQSL